MGLGTGDPNLPDKGVEISTTVKSRLVMKGLYAGRTAVLVTDEAVQILGGYGYILENEVERYYRDAKITEIYEGTKEIQKNTIAGVLIRKK